jgi:hypothetical protein
MFEILSFVIGCAVTTLVIQYITWKVAGFKPSLKQAFLAGLAARVMGGVLLRLIRVVGLIPDISFIYIAWILSFVSGAFCYSLMLRKEDSTPIGVPKAMLISLVELLIYVAVFGASLYVYWLVKMPVAPPAQ